MGKKSASGAGQKPNKPPGAVPAATEETETVVPTSAPPLGHGHGHHPHIEFKFFKELKHRNVVRVAVLYLLACWLILDPVHVVFHMLEVPAWANRLVLILMAIGLPAVLLFAWAFEITPEGLKPTVEVDPKKSIRLLTGRRLDRAIIVVLVLALGYFVADKFWLAKREPVPESVATKPTAPLPPAAIAVPEKSIAVLPFVDMSEKKDQEYFSDDLTEELIDRLSHSPELKVIARTSSFSFKGKSEDVRAIASKFGVAYLLEGSVRKAGSELRITVQLIRAADGTHLWSHTYDRNLADIFKLQDEIAGTVAQALNVALKTGIPGERDQRSPDAHNLLLQGDFFLHRGTEQDTEKAVDFYKRAILLDPNYALALERLATASMLQVFHGGISITEGNARAREALKRALKIDPNLASAHASLGSLYELFDWNWQAAQTEYKRARELDPSDDSAQTRLARIDAFKSGRFDEVIAAFDQHLLRDPLDTVALWRLGVLLVAAGRLNEAEAAWRKLEELSPKYNGGHFWWAMALVLMGRNTEALATVKRESEESMRLSALPAVYWSLGRRAESDAALNELKEKYAADNAYQIAEMHAYRGEVESAFEWLERAYRQRDGGMVYLRVDPILSNLHGDSRYKGLLAKMKLAD
jgi:TolB-like protein/cytochrome c-type biogenesis protein CcmH/NrfG